MAKIKIIARYNDGRLLKGTTDNFSPEMPSFHLMPADESQAKAVSVQIQDLKAVFVVHDFAGKPDYRESKEFVDGRNAMGTRLQIQFRDGETMLGHSMNFDLSNQGFFIFPADPESNNQRIYVVSQAVKEVKQVA
ncbi:MAG: hypothetical protein WD768_21220 [Phycisphaeraceae bacterium]